MRCLQRGLRERAQRHVVLIVRCHHLRVFARACVCVRVGKRLSACVLGSCARVCVRARLLGDPPRGGSRCAARFAAARVQHRHIFILRVGVCVCVCVCVLRLRSLRACR